MDDHSTREASAGRERGRSYEVCAALDALAERADERGSVAVYDLVEIFGRRGYGALLMVPALIEISPIGGIPGVPTLIALLIVVFAVQIAVGRRHMWLPGFLGRREISSGKLATAVEKLRPIARRLDRWFHGRLTALTGVPFVQIAAAVCVALALTVPPLEVVPFASTAPMAAIAMFGLALLVHDGALMIVASLIALTAVGTAGAVLL